MIENQRRESLDQEQQGEVRSQVKRLLQRSDAFIRLPKDQRLKVAEGLVNVLGYLADPKAGQKDLNISDKPNAELLEMVEAQAKKGQRSNNKKSTQEAKPHMRTAGEDFVPGATQAAADTYEQLVGAVDFPQFVSSLVEGVFTSIVDSSIRQMQEYAKFLEAVVKSVNEFKNEHITEADGRDSIVDQFPNFFEVKGQGGKSALSLKPGVDEDNMPDLKSAFGFEGQLDLSDPESEKKLVESARLKMARMRQQQLATMVLLGINRIVVTNGHINAKVFIDVKARDTVQSRNYASQYDGTSEINTSSNRNWLGTSRRSHVDTKVSSALSTSKTESESEAKMRANLTGSVRINFKSETFPLEKIGSPSELTALNEKSVRK